VLLIAVVVGFNLASLILLIEVLLGGKIADGGLLLQNSLKLWITNVIGFGMWYWEMDRGGPARRRMDVKRHEDFLFPQMVSPEFAQRGWVPDFWDYYSVNRSRERINESLIVESRPVHRPSNLPHPKGEGAEPPIYPYSDRLSVYYLYLSFTNATAFSPTDTMPLTGRAKMLMTMQSFIALLTITLVAARAVNILK
jgi:hypothetical protein